MRKKELYVMNKVEFQEKHCSILTSFSDRIVPQPAQMNSSGCGPLCYKNCRPHEVFNWSVDCQDSPDIVSEQNNTEYLDFFSL